MKTITELPNGVHVTVQCQVCGRKTCFCPDRVMFTNTCECGNDDYGRISEWKYAKFGKFKLVQVFTLSFDIFAKPKPFLRQRLFFLSVKQHVEETFRIVKWEIPRKLHYTKS